MVNFFDKRDRWGNDLSMWAVVGMVFLIPLAVWSLSSTQMENEVHHWIPKDNVEYRKFDWYKRHFPAEEAVIVTWEGSALDDPRAERLERKLVGAKEADGSRRGGSKYVGRVRSPHEVIAQMRKNKIPREAAIERLKGILVGAGPLRIRLTEAG